MGSHASYFNKGDHGYLPGLNDHTDKSYLWDTAKTLDVIFPWNYQDKITQVEGWEGVNWLTQIFRWGNHHMGFAVGEK